MKYLVDVIMPVYNHGLYIAEAIESIISQKTNFSYRLIIGEDCSTDNSRAIIAKYETTYPEKIFPVYHPKNLGAQANGSHMLSIAEAKYIAICEGDDYWIDEYKLQKQVDFLEANPDFSMCFTDVKILDELGWNKPWEDYFPKIEKDVLIIDDFILSYMSVIPTPTIMFRNVIPKPVPDFYLKTLSADICIHFMVADKGKTKYLSDTTAVYRNHSGGITKTKEALARTYDMRINMYEEANAYFSFRYNSQFRQQLVYMIRIRMIYGSRNLGFRLKVKNFRRNIGKYIKYSDKINYKEIVYFVAVLFFPSMLKMVGKKSSQP